MGDAAGLLEEKKYDEWEKHTFYNKGRYCNLQGAALPCEMVDAGRTAGQKRRVEEPWHDGGGGPGKA